MSGGNITAIFAPGNAGNIPLVAGIYGGGGNTVGAFASTSSTVYRNIPYFTFDPGDSGVSVGNLDGFVVEVVAAVPLVFATAMTYFFQLWKTSDITTAGNYTELASGSISIPSASPVFDVIIEPSVAGQTITSGERLFFAFFRGDSGASTLASLMVTASLRVTT